MRGWKKWLLLIVLAIILLLGALIALGIYADWAAERDAREFCDETPIGSDISTAASRADNRKLLWAGGHHNAPVGSTVSPYTFYFFGAFIFDKAVCEVSVDAAGRVRSKHSEMQPD